MNTGTKVMIGVLGLVVALVLGVLTILVNKWIGIIALFIFVLVGLVLVVIFIIRKVNEKPVPITSVTGVPLTTKRSTPTEALVNATKRLPETLGDYIASIAYVNTGSFGQERTEPIFLLVGMTYWDSEHFIYVENLDDPERKWKILKNVDEDRLVQEMNQLATNPQVMETIEQVPYITPEGVQALKKVTRRETHQERAANEEIARRSDVEAL